MRSQTSSSATTTPTSVTRRPQRMFSPERLSDASSIGLLILLEVLPIQAALLVYAAGSSGSLAVVFGPLWLIVATLLAFALARWRLGRLSPAWLTLAALVLGVVVLALFTALSPTVYGESLGGLFSLDWLRQLQVDAFHETSQLGRVFAIALFVVYLGWRGIALGVPPPRIDTTLRRYAFSLSVVMFACLVALAAPEAAQASLQSDLLALLALDVFAGLAAAALARRGVGRESAVGETSGAETIRWLLTAFGAAALVVAVAFGLGLAFNLRLARPLIVALGYIGGVLSAAVDWLALAVAYVLWFIFVNTIGRLSFTGSYTIPPPKQPPSISHQPAKHAVIAPPPHELVVAATILVALIGATLLVVALYRVIRSVLGAMRSTTEPEVDEEREALDARGLLRRQLDDLLAGLRRRPPAEDDPLARGSVRWHYREMLRAGAAAGMARRDGETADEYSERLARSAQERGEGELGLAELTRAYDDARYGESAAAAPSDVVAEARAATTALARLRAER